jgi:predicted TIM-barrel fold metal-dependent hydrolase
MKLIAGVASALALLAGAVSAKAQVPAVDHHQHLFSPALAALISPPPPAAPVKPLTATDLIAHLDAAGIKRAVVLSTAYIFEQPTRKVDDAYTKVRAENDWTSQQVAQYPDRLVGFCGLNPIKDYALDELARCAKDPNLRRGLKLHFGNSAVDYHNAEHIERVRRVFRTANDYRMAIVVHMRASFSQKLAYGPDEARIFLNELVPAAPDVVIQIAHLAGGGGPGDQAAQQALDVFVDAVVKGDARAKQLWFDVTGIGPLLKMTADELALFASKIRQLGVQRIVFGADGATAGNPPPKEWWAAFRTLPLSDEEFRTIANNIAPYMR